MELFAGVADAFGQYLLYKHMDVLRRLGREIPELDEQMCHIIASGMFNGIFEIVIHDMPREQALRDVDQLRDFYTAGWLKLMGA